MAVHYITQTSEVEALLPKLMEKPNWGADSETTGLDPLTDRVTLVQIGNQQDQYVIDTRKTTIEPLRPFYESRTIRKVGHHFKFDYKMMKGTFGIDVECIRDTMLADKVYNNGRKLKGFGLDDALEGYLGVQLDKTLQKSFIGHVGDYSQEQIAYAAKDVEYMLPLASHFIPLLQQDGLYDTWLLECNVTACFGDMEFNGVRINREKWKALIDKNLARANELKKQMDEFARGAKGLFQENLFGEIDINYSSPAQMLQLLNGLGIRIEETVNGEKKRLPLTDTNDRTLKKIGKYPVVKLLDEYRSAMIRVTTFGQSFLDAIHPKTGRIHAEFDQLGTETGRPASHSKSPVNLLNIPREKEMRNCFEEGDDELVQTDDYSGCELRIWAYLSQDPLLCDAFAKGLDVHCYVASKLYGVEVTKKNENAHLRTPVKTLNFGIAYGMGPLKLYEKLNGDGYPISFEDAKKLYYNYCDEFETGVGYLRESGRQAVNMGYAVNAAGRRRYWLMPDPHDREKYPNGFEDKGYKGRIGGIEREGGNFKIQSVNVEMTKHAMVGIRDWSKETKNPVWTLNSVYDEIVTKTKKGISAEFVKVKQDIMIAAASRYLSGRDGFRDVPMEVEGHVYQYWTK